MKNGLVLLVPLVKSRHSRIRFAKHVPRDFLQQPQTEMNAWNAQLGGSRATARMCTQRARLDLTLKAQRRAMSVLPVSMRPVTRDLRAINVQMVYIQRSVKTSVGHAKRGKP